MRKPRAKPKRGERAKGRKTNERLQAYRQEMKGVEGLVNGVTVVLRRHPSKIAQNYDFVFAFTSAAAYSRRSFRNSSRKRHLCSSIANLLCMRCYIHIGFLCRYRPKWWGVFFLLSPLSVGKIMSFPPNLARPRVRCFSIFAFTSSPLGYKSLSDSVISVKAKRRFAFTRKNIEGRCAKSADSIAEDSSTR